MEGVTLVGQTPIRRGSSQLIFVLVSIDTVSLELCQLLKCCIAPKGVALSLWENGNEKPEK